MERINITQDEVVDTSATSADTAVPRPLPAVANPIYWSRQTPQHQPLHPDATEVVPPHNNNNNDSMVIDDLQQSFSEMPSPDANSPPRKHRNRHSNGQFSRTQATSFTPSNLQLPPPDQDLGFSTSSSISSSCSTIVQAPVPTRLPTARDEANIRAISFGLRPPYSNPSLPSHVPRNWDANSMAIMAMLNPYRSTGWDTQAPPRTEIYPSLDSITRSGVQETPGTRRSTTPARPPLRR